MEIAFNAYTRKIRAAYKQLEFIRV